MSLSIEQRLARVLHDLRSIQEDISRAGGITLEQATTAETFAASIAVGAAHLMGKAQTAKAQHVERTTGYSEDGRASWHHAEKVRQAVQSALGLF
jgi:hypothetical protein